MKRTKEEFVSIVDEQVGLKGKKILEIGCGDGSRSEELAQRCKRLIGIDTNRALIIKANRRSIPNASFFVGDAERMSFENRSFDIVLFTLSFHHVPIPAMGIVLDEAKRVLEHDGFFVFLEPGMTGSFFDCEIAFDACDGDEREAKDAAYLTMMGHEKLVLFSERRDETVFQFESLDDFLTSMKPKKNLETLESFLTRHNYVLQAERRINIFQPL